MLAQQKQLSQEFTRIRIIDSPLLFNIFINDLILFMQCTILGNYADDNNVSISGSNKENNKKFLLSDFKILTEWFHDNYMIINPDKCSYMCIGKNNNDDDTFSFNEFNPKNSNKEPIVGMKLDRTATILKPYV